MKKVRKGKGIKVKTRISVMRKVGWEKMGQGKE